MISKDPALRLRHILFHISGVIDMLEGVDFDGFSSSYALERATERAVSIISEAAKLLSTDLRERYPEVPWSHIIGIGNILRHEYERVDSMIMWDIVRNHLPPMAGVVSCMLDDMSDASD